MRSKWILGTALGAVLATGFAPLDVARADTAQFNRPSRAAASEVTELENRRKALFDKMMANPADLDSAFEYAALSSQLGDLEGAIGTLERMLIFAPSLPRLQLELGVLYFRLGAYATAGTYFDAAVSGEDVPQEVRSKVAQYQTAIAQKSETTAFSGSLSAGARYQSNANNGPASALVTLNNLQYALSGNALKTGDVNGFMAGDFQAVFDLPAQGAQFKVNFQGLGELYRKRDDLHFGYAELTAGPSIDLNRFGLEGTSIDLYGIAGGGILSGDPFFSSLGAGVLLGLRPTADSYYGLRGEYRHETFYRSDDQPTLNEKSGDRLRGSVAATYRLSSSTTLGLAGMVDHFDAATDRNSYWQGGGVVGLSFDYASPIDSLPGPWNFSLSNEFSRREHEAADPMISASRQQTIRWGITATQTIPLSKDWAAQVQAGFQKAWSNYDTSEYDNAIVSVSVKKVF